MSARNLKTQSRKQEGYDWNEVSEGIFYLISQRRGGGRGGDRGFNQTTPKLKRKSSLVQVLFFNTPQTLFECPWSPRRQFVVLNKCPEQETPGSHESESVDLTATICIRSPLGRNGLGSVQIHSESEG